MVDDLRDARLYEQLGTLVAREHGHIDTLPRWGGGGGGVEVRGGCMEVETEAPVTHSVVTGRILNLTG